MSRVAVYLFFVAIILNGIIKSSQADDTSAEASKKPDDETPKPPPEDETPKETDHTQKPTEPKQDKDAKTTDAKTKDAKTTDTKTTDTKKEEVGKDNSETFLDKLNPARKDFGDSILGPVMQARARIGDAVSKGFDSAKHMADDVYKFFKDSVTKII